MDKVQIHLRSRGRFFNGSPVASSIPENFRFQACIMSDAVPGYKKPLILDCDICSFNRTLL